MIFAPYIIIIMHTAMQYRKTVICLLAAFCLPLCIRGQKNDDENILNRYIMITRMVTDGQFTAAEKELEELIPLLNPENGLKRINAESLLLECRIRNARPDIDGLVYAFMTEYPQCERQEELMLLYAGHYFDRKNYEKASEILEGINTEELSPLHATEYKFKKAYCLMRTGRSEEALPVFEDIISGQYTDYTAPSIYYSAYIHYINKRFEQCIPLLERITGNDIYGKLARYYLLEANFMLDNYDYVILNGRSLYEESDREYQLKIARLLSEAYLEKDMPKEARMFFEIYSASGINLTRNDTYYAGVISYSLQSYLSAADAFSETAGDSDLIGQSSYMYLGNCCLKLKNKIAALDAYKKASETDFDQDIKENAFYNYAKLAFDIHSDIAPFNSYLEKYPQSGKSDEIHNYIAESFLLSKDYKSAIDALSKISSPNAEVIRNLQKAAFFMAMQLLEKGAYESSERYFKLSIENSSYDRSLCNLAKFWLAEALYRNEDYENAISLEKELLEDPGFRLTDEAYQVLYNLGYACIKSGDYAEAEKWFGEYLALAPSQRYHTLDAKIRLADSYFMQSKYDRSAELYEEASKFLNDSYEVYPMYQGALSFGLISNNGKKIEMLEDIRKNYKGCYLYPQSVYELGRTYLRTGKNDKAIKTFKGLLEYDDSSYYAKAKLEIGLTYFNMEDRNKALKYYKEVVQDYPETQEAYDALAGIESIYQETGRLDDYFAYLDTMGLTGTKTEEEKENMYFNSAERMFLSKNYTNAIAAFRDFMEKYPQSAHSVQADFYMAESLKNTGNPEAACEHFLKVMKNGTGSFTEIAALNYANISYGLENYENALGAYEFLRDMARLDNNRNDAKAGIARSKYRLKDYAGAVAEAESILSQAWAPEGLKTEMEYIAAKSLYADGKRDEAKKIFETLSEDPLSAEGAESAYLLILDAFESGDFESVESMTFSLAESRTGQRYWLAKSFIVLGDSYAERGEWKQAEATFRSILDGYERSSDNDDVTENVKIRLDAIAKHYSDKYSTVLKTQD